MICLNCGKAVPDSSKFCRYCGSRIVNTGTKICPECGRQGEVDEIYCENCGTLMVRQSVSDQEPMSQTKSVSDQEPMSQTKSVSNQGPMPQTKGVTNQPPNAVKADSNRVGQTAENSWVVLKRLHLVSQYEGEPKVAPAKATGELCVYSDRIVFNKKLGNSLGGAFGMFGMVLAQREIKNNPVDIYPYSELIGIHVGKYAGVYNTLVLVLRNGNTVSFATALPGSSEPEEIVNLIRQHQSGL